MTIPEGIDLTDTILCMVDRQILEAEWDFLEPRCILLGKSVLSRLADWIFAPPPESATTIHIHDGIVYDAKVLGMLRSLPVAVDQQYEWQILVVTNARGGVQSL